MSVYRNNTEALSQYLQSMVKLEELQKMTEDLDKELEDSQRLMLEIKSIFNAVPDPNVLINDVPEVRQEQRAQFLVADAPRLLMPGMAEVADVDLDVILSDIKSYAEDLKQNISLPQPQQKHSKRVTENLNLEQYAASLDQLAKRLANIKLNKNNKENNRNEELETKLTQLFQDVNNFTQMVQNTKQSEASKDWKPSQDNAPLLSVYDNLMDKLLQHITDATYLLKNKN